MGCLNEIIVKSEWTDIIIAAPGGEIVSSIHNFKESDTPTYASLIQLYQDWYGKQNHQMIVLEDGIDFTFADGGVISQLKIQDMPAELIVRQILEEESELEDADTSIESQ